jgi:hypothetical protein
MIPVIAPAFPQATLVSLVLLVAACQPSPEYCAEWTRKNEVACLNRVCEGDILPKYDWKQSELLKFNGVWYLGPKKYYSSGIGGASFSWPLGAPESTQRSIDVFLNGRGSWLIPSDISAPRPKGKSILDQSREAGDLIERTSIRPGLDRYLVQHQTSYGPQPFALYVATDRSRITGEGWPTLYCRSNGSCTSGDSLQLDLYADYRVEKADADDWPEIHSEIVRVLGLLVPVGPAAAVDRRPEHCHKAAGT